MKRNFFIGILILLFTTSAYSQVVLEGVALKRVEPYGKGSKVKVYGCRTVSPELKQYLIEGVDGYRYVNENKIELTSELGFWEEAWFNNRGADIAKSGWDESKREQLYNDALDYLFQAEGNNLIYDDEVLYDYLYQLIAKIHPEKLVKPASANFGVIIIKSYETDWFSFDNGFLVLTTGLIAQTKSEKELIEILAQAISHIVLEHNLLNLKRAEKSQKTAEILGTVAAVASSAAMINSNKKYNTNYYLEDAVDIGIATYFLSGDIIDAVGANYSSEQKVKAKKVSNSYMSQLNEDELITDKEYTARISDVISYSAWQEYNLMNYGYSLELANRVLENNIATERDYLLLSKLCRVISNDKESNLKALGMIKRAKGVGLINLIDLDKELGIIYLRLGDRKNAEEAFISYKSGLFELEKQGVDISDELEFVNNVLFRYKMTGL